MSNLYRSSDEKVIAMFGQQTIDVDQIGHWLMRQVI